MRGFLDLNVLLDLFLKRSPWVGDAAAIWTAHQDGRITAGISASSLTTLYYLIRKAVGQAFAQDVVRDCLNGVAIWKVDAGTIALAIGQSGSDFEDNVQLACAMESNADVIVTRDLTGFAGSAIPVLSPAAFVARLPPTPTP